MTTTLLTYHRPADAAFTTAIQEGRLSKHHDAHNYAGHYMYMGTNAIGVDQFKHIDTRQYLDCSRERAHVVERM